MRISEEFGSFWRTLTGGQKAALIVPAALVMLLLFYGWGSAISAWWQVSKHERDANSAKREMLEALKRAADIAKEKAALEKSLAETEAKRDGKQTEAEKAHIDTLAARDEYARTLRERRADDPGADQLCTELAALGYPCT